MGRDGLVLPKWRHVDVQPSRVCRQASGALKLEAQSGDAAHQLRGRFTENQGEDLSAQMGEGAKTAEPLGFESAN